MHQTATPTLEAGSAAMVDGVRWSRSSYVLKQSRALGKHVSEVQRPRGGVPLALRIDKIRGSAQITTLTREARAWANAAARDPRILPLLDWGVREPDTVLFLAPLAHPVTRLPEKQAISVTRSIAAVVARLDSPHGNIGPHSVFIARDGSAVIGGWGASRVAALENGASRTDDARAIARLLYFILSGREYTGGKVRLDKSAVSSDLRKLLRQLLEDDYEPSLLELRYDLGSIAGDLPVCTRALPPSEHKRKKETLLRADLNSVNGSISRREAELLASPPQRPSRSARGNIATTESAISVVHSIIPAVSAPTSASVHNVAVAAPVSVASSAAVEESVTRLISPDLEEMNLVELNELVQQCSAQPSLVDVVFKTMFKRPLGKNPVVGFKGLILIHTLLREGPPEATSHAATHDGFLGWVEASWSRERIQSRPAHKAHRLSHCFAVGELAWYAAFLRRRTTFFLTYSAIFAPRWNVRADAQAYTANNNRALRAALSVLEGAASVLKRVVASSDPAEVVKRWSALSLTTDVKVAYHACCWLYATAHPTLKRNMVDDLESAHNATRSVFRVVSSAPLIISQLPPSTILQLDDTPPRDFDISGSVPSPTVLTNGHAKKKTSGLRKSNADETETSETALETKTETNQSSSDDESDTIRTVEIRKKEKTKSKAKRKKEKQNGAQQSGESEQVSRKSTLEYDAPPRLTTVQSVDDDDSVSRDLHHYDDEGHVPPRSKNGRKKRDADVSSEDAQAEARQADTKEKKSRRNGRGKKVAARRRKDEDSSTDGEGDESSIESDDSEDARERKRAVKKNEKLGKRSEKKRTAEKIPPPRKAPVVVPPNGNSRVVARVENRQGSKEALAAAASGQKTPQINPSFECAPYEVQFGQQIGSGGFGVVFKAKFRGNIVAVKKIHSHALSNRASIGEFQSEVAVLCTLKHPNILAFMGACTKPPNLMIITEFMGRGTLFDVLHQSQLRITWPMRRRFALDTCRGMRYLHDSKLLHRDLKSSNLMLDNDFNCKVGDFGLTRTSAGTAAVQMTGQCGTFQYMAVEVLANKPYSEKADVFSFGILLWEMVARKLPYFGMQPMQVGIAVVQQGLRPTIPPRTPAPLSKLMQACWDTDPNRRPSFAQLVQMLEAMPE